MAVCALSASSCVFSHSKATKIVPPAIVAPPPKPVEEKPPQIPPPEANPPATAPVPEPNPSKSLEVTPELPGPPKEPKRPRRARARTPQPAPAPAAGPAATPIAEPELAPLLSASDKRAYEAIVNAMVARTEKNLAAVESKDPNPQQRDVIRQSRNFLAQCQEIRSRDLAAAKSLAERAEILSRELVSRIR